VAICVPLSTLVCTLLIGPGLFRVVIVCVASFVYRVSQHIVFDFSILFFKFETAGFFLP